MPYSVGNHFYFSVPAAERDAWELQGKCRSFARQGTDGEIDAVAEAPRVLSDPAMVFSEQVLVVTQRGPATH
jgi:galactose mutarotase-like enzyme